MTYFNECEICAQQVEERGLDDSDRASLKAWHNRYHH